MAVWPYINSPYSYLALVSLHVKFPITHLAAIKINDMKLSTIVSLIASLQLCSANKSNKSFIIIALPQDDDENVTSWEKGAEILPGAYVAVEGINKDSSVLSNVNLELVIAESGLIFSKDEKYSGNVLEISADLAWQNKDVIGIAGLLHPNTLRALQAFQLPLASLIGFSNSQLPESGVISLTASTSMLTDSLSAFLAIINQTRIGVISESTHSYYSTVSNNLLTKANVSLYIHISNSHHRSFSDIVDEVANFNIRVIFLSVRPSIALSVLLEACKRRMKWPNHAWILHSYRLEDLRELVLPAGEVCDASNILEGVFMFQLTQERRDFNSDAKSLQAANPVAFLLHDAVWALALAAQNKDNNRISLKDSIYQYSDIYIYQASNLSAELVGIYSGKSNAFTNVTVGTLVYDGPILQSVVLSPYLMLLSGSCLLFNTLLLILYICFRNHPDVKSTSVSLSLLIFIGCYLLIGFTIVDFFSYAFHTVDVCMGSVWLGGLGLSLPLILATVLVKMLRVYHIFTLQRRWKQNVCTNYVAPIIYTLIMLLPHAIVLTLWSVIDSHLLNVSYIEYPELNRVMVIISCTSRYPLLWYTLSIAYQISLSLAVVFIAIKTRKVRLAQFKDTKKVNLFIHFTYFAGLTCFAYWLTLSAIDPYGPSRGYVLNIGHIILVLITHFTLFVPKIWPPLVEKVTGSLNKTTPASRIETVSSYSKGSSIINTRV